MAEVAFKRVDINNSHTFESSKVVSLSDMEDCQFRHFPASCSYVNFLQKKEEEILKELHREIETLKHENSELKFQLHVALKSTEPKLDYTVHNHAYKLQEAQSIIDIGQPLFDDERDKELEEERLRVKKLQLELESATKMLEEVKWVQMHYETRMQLQELKIEELQKQLFDLKTTELEVIQFQIPSKQCQIQKPSFPKEYQPPRQRSSSIAGYRDHDSFQRRGSHSLLPDNYKETVATLPPIQGPVISNPPNTNTNISMNTNSTVSSVKVMKTRLNRMGNLGETVTSSDANTATASPSTSTNPAAVAASTSKKK